MPLDGGSPAHDRSSSGVVMEGDPDERIADDDVESTTILPLVAVTCVGPESVTVVPDVARTRRAAFE